MVKLVGHVEATLIDARTGQIKRTVKGRNLLVTNGATELAKIITSATSGTRPTHMGIGTSTTAPAAAQTALQSTATILALGSTSRSANAITYSCTFGTGKGTGTIQEAGLFNAAAAGTMFARWLTGAFVKGSTDSLTVRWTLTFGTM